MRIGHLFLTTTLFAVFLADAAYPNIRPSLFVLGGLVHNMNDVSIPSSQGINDPRSKTTYSLGAGLEFATSGAARAGFLGTYKDRKSKHGKAIVIESLYTQRGYKSSSQDVTLNFICVPAYIKIYSSIFDFYAGAYGAFRVGAVEVQRKSDVSNPLGNWRVNSNWGDPDIAGLDYGGLAGAGVRIGRGFFVTARYYFGLKDLITNETQPGGGFKVRAAEALIGGYW